MKITARITALLITGGLFVTPAEPSDAPTASEPTAIYSVLPRKKQVSGSDLQSYRTTTAWGEQRLIAGEVDGRKTWNLINAIYAAENPMIDHIVLDRHSLELIARFAPYFAIGKHYLAAVLGEGALNGSLIPLDSGETLDMGTKLAAPVFEEAVLGLILASLPLAEGYSATLPRLAISASTRAFSAGVIAISVTGRESIKAGDGNEYASWVVEAKWSGVDYQETHWISDQPPYSIRKVAVFPNGGSRESGFLTVTTGE